jgi:hypothetical protein
MPSVITREQFLTKAPVTIQVVAAPELGGIVYVKGMTARERSAFEKQFQTSSGKSNKRKLQEIRERLVVACLCDEGGTLILREEDVGVVGSQPITVVERIVSAAQGVCGMSDKDVDALVGNSEETEEDF